MAKYLPDSPYNGSGALTREQFLFFETRVMAKLICDEGLADSEAIKRVVDENLFQFPTERMVETMKMQKSKKGKFFLACTGYPACHETALIDVDLVERYFYRHGSICQRCTRCNCSLEAKLGQYGLYIQCCGSQRHQYKLDEI